jgi:hypothetical protein
VKLEKSKITKTWMREIFLQGQIPRTTGDDLITGHHHKANIITE